MGKLKTAAELYETAKGSDFRIEELLDRHADKIHELAAAGQFTYNLREYGFKNLDLVSTSTGGRYGTDCPAYPQNDLVLKNIGAALNKLGFKWYWTWHGPAYDQNAGPRFGDMDDSPRSEAWVRPYGLVISWSIK